MIRAAVIGATGYAGAELVRILAGHPDVRLDLLTSRQYAGERFDKVFASMAGVVDLSCESYSADAVAGRCDMAFIALPHQLPMDIVPELLARNVRVVDLSADFRFSDVERYEKFYQPHKARETLSQSVYGLAEVYTERIRSSHLIGNPGCYPTSILLPLVPLLEAGVLDTESLIADSKSGVSGAGRSPALGSMYSEVSESFKAYKVNAHRHNPEIDEVLSRHGKKPVHITFTPHLLPMSRGMLSTIYASLEQRLLETELTDIIREYYRDRPFIRVCGNDRLPDTRNVRGTNFCDIGLKVDAAGHRAIILSAIDNLVKGAAGQAVQNMNLMFGLQEKAGLWNVPSPV